MKKEKKYNNKIANNYWGFGEAYFNINIVFKWLMSIILIVGFVNLSTAIVVENQTVYESCTKAGEVPNLGKHTLKAFDKEFTSIEPSEIMALPSCVSSCNNMYLKLRGK